MGLVEFGVRCGSHVAAGRSYHGVEESPCVEGTTKGASLASLREDDEARGSIDRAAVEPVLMASLS